MKPGVRCCKKELTINRAGIQALARALRVLKKTPAPNGCVVPLLYTMGLKNIRVVEE